MKNIYRTIIFAAWGAVLAFSFSACKSAVPTNSVPVNTTPNDPAPANTAPNDPVPTNSVSEQKKKLRIGIAQDSNEPGGVFAAAIKKGFLKEELDKVGYEAEWLGFAAAGPAINEAFIGGSLDMAFYGNLPPVTLKGKGFDIKLISFLDKYYYTVLVAPDSDIQTVKDLEGKKVLVGRGTINDEYWSDLVSAYGVDESKVEIVNDPANAISMFVSGDADAITNSYQLKYRFAAQSVPFREIENNQTSHPEFASQVVLVGRGAFLNDNPDVAVAVLRAYIRTYDYVDAHREEIPDLFATEIIPKELAAAIQVDNPNYLENQKGEITDEAIARLQRLPDFLASHGYLDETFDVKTLIDDSYYKKAAQEVRGK